MATSLGDMLEREFRILPESSHEPFRALTPFGVDCIESREHLGAESTLDLSQAKIVRPEAIDVVVDIAHGRLPITRSPVRIRTHSVMPQPGDQGGKCWRCHR